MEQRNLLRGKAVKKSSRFSNFCKTLYYLTKMYTGRCVFQCGIVCCHSQNNNTLQLLRKYSRSILYVQSFLGIKTQLPSSFY